MINMIRNTDRSWSVTITHGTQRVHLWFVVGTKTEITRQAKIELARMQAAA